jgi:hypothetical protein
MGLGAWILVKHHIPPQLFSVRIALQANELPTSSLFHFPVFQPTAHLRKSEPAALPSSSKVYHHCKENREKGKRNKHKSTQLLKMYIFSSHLSWKNSIFLAKLNHTSTY